MLIFGLILSIALMGVAASFIARLLQKHRWIAYVGLPIILYVAVEMIYRGAHEVLPLVNGGKSGCQGNDEVDRLSIRPEVDFHFRINPMLHSSKSASLSAENRIHLSARCARAVSTDVESALFLKCAAFSTVNRIHFT